MLETVGKKRTRSIPNDPSQTSLFAYIKKDKSEKRRKALSTITNLQKEAHESPAPTIISYRDDNWGGGAYYDHYAIQKITSAPTAIAPIKEDKDIDKSLKHLIFHLANHVTHNLKFGHIDEKSQRLVPDVIEKFDTNQGLLVFPGVARTVYEKRTNEYEQRIAAQKKLLSRALLIGQPILGICGGSWHLWEYFDGKTKEAKGHSCRVGMPRIKDTTGKIGHNIQVHRIIIENDALLLKAALNLIEIPTEHLPVNSVHWRAPAFADAPAFYVVSAKPKRDDGLAPKKAKGTVMQPDEGCVEAFESRFGAPILGIQWHPEAYTNNTDKRFYPINQQHLLKYMVQAGQTFKNRRTLVREFAEICKDSTSFTGFKNKKLRKTGLIDNNYLVVKENKGQVNKKRNTEDEAKPKVSPGSPNSIRFKIFRLQKQDSLRHKEEAENEIRIKKSYLAEKQHRNDAKLSTYYGYFRVNASLSQLKLKKGLLSESPLVNKLEPKFPFSPDSFWNSVKKVRQESLEANEFLVETESRESLRNPPQVKLWLNNIIPSEFCVGSAIGKGDCFFDAIAQALNQRFPDKQYSAKSLRSLCDQYAKDKKNTWVENANLKDRQNHEQYLVRIQFNAKEIEDLEQNGLTLGAPIWGRPNIEGRMFCEIFGITIHLIEIQDDGSINRFMFNQVGQTEDYNPMIDYNDSNIIHIITYHNHCVPLLKPAQMLVPNMKK